ncbi:hypothetical protein RN001_010638 [Aquatica leii]|uniref:TRAFD1/XAF1 zinc finger domain-containing protein n=1 Tax=Aquatica leii TaxID=1421715 RepID=A0AAN7SEK3_9COLE|nr:hypothetical protein RN001_010638 [Aquatica leii]
MNEQVELEICGNCKREIPHHNYVMHSMHCARNISLCAKCKEPIPKSDIEKHTQLCKTSPPKLKPIESPSKLEQSSYFVARKEIEDKKVQVRKEKQMQRMEKLVGVGNQLGSYNGTPLVANNPVPVNQLGSFTNRSTVESNPIKQSSLLPCQYCELELPKFDLQEHENYCGARTEKCLDCGEMVMFRYRQLHRDTNHGILNPESKETPRRRPPSFNIETYSMPYISNPSTGPLLRTTDSNGEKLESSKEISRRLDCKTEYIRNLLHDSASITAPIRSTGAVPRHRSSGTIPESPNRYRNPPTEVVIPCEFCKLPIPHEDLIEHETGCRPDLARYNPRRNNNSPDYFTGPEPSSPEVDLPCEFCSDLIPASQLLTHQATCN